MYAFSKCYIFNGDAIVTCFRINLHAVNKRFCCAVIQPGNGIRVCFSIIVNIRRDGYFGRIDIGNCLILKLGAGLTGSGISGYITEYRILPIIAAVGAVISDIVDIKSKLLVDVG